jgi:DNA-binding MarR family transcriptional regulator
MGNQNGNGKPRPAVALVMEHASEDLTQGEYLVLVAIASYADADGRAWPTIESLARRARVTERTVNRAIKTLQEIGELEVESRASGRRSNSYVVAVATRDDLRHLDVVSDDPATSDIPGPTSDIPGSTSDIWMSHRSPLEVQIEDQEEFPPTSTELVPVNDNDLAPREDAPVFETFAEETNRRYEEDERRREEELYRRQNLRAPR